MVSRFTQLKPRSFQGQMRLLLVGAVVTAVALLCVMLLGMNLYTQQHAAQRKVETIGHIIAMESAAALRFDDSQAANETLQSLSTSRHIVAATIVDREGELFAAYASDEAHDPAHLLDDHDHGMFDGEIDLALPIIDDREQLGTLKLHYNLRDVYAQMAWIAAIGVAVAVFATAAAVTAGQRLARAIGSPMQNLVAVADRITRERSYNVRAVPGPVHEFRKLVEAFNAMLDAVQTRDAELLLAQQDLERRVRQRTAELEHATRVAEAANSAKSEFLANMSHEIRTPMTAILGFTDMMRNDAIDKADLTNAMQAIDRNGKHLLRLINDILDLSKIEAGKMEVEQLACDPRQVVEDVASMMRVRAEEKGIAFNTEFVGPMPREIQSDPTRLRQILVNLIGNAIKFTQTGGVRIIARLNGTPENAKLRFEVMDTGIGMSEEQLTRVFEPFSQADATVTRQFGGTGLGLAISRRLVSILGGEISATSMPGEGSTFTVALDLGPHANLDLVEVDRSGDGGDEPSDHNASLDSQPSRSARILLAEDGPDNQRLIKLVLTKADHRVDVADNGRVALDKALAADRAGEPYDVILMDMQMPKMDGYTAAAKLREAGYDGPIIALTAHAMQGDREKCISAGCDDYATKPIDRQALLNTIARHLRDVAGTINASP